MGKVPRYIVFTDASHRSDRKGHDYCGYGVVILNVETRHYMQFGGELGDRTAAFGETWAIYQGVKNAIKFCSKEEKTDILIVTDSKLNVKTMSVFIPYVWDTSDWHNWKKVDGKPVKNQEIYRRIVELIRRNSHVHVRITHVNSHLTHKDWRRIQFKLEKYNIMADEETSKMFMDMNAIADEIAKTITANMREEDQLHGPFFKLIPKEK